VNPLHTAHGPDAELGLMRPDERVLHWDSRAKYAVAFFRMSRSSVTRANSRFSHRFSASWLKPGAFGGRFLEKPHPLVKRVRTRPQALRNLPKRIPTHPDLLHRITLELVASVARPHLGLLASKFGGKASTNLGAPQTDFAMT
jgi:hypothetical protein